MTPPEIPPNRLLIALVAILYVLKWPFIHQNWKTLVLAIWSRLQGVYNWFMAPSNWKIRQGLVNAVKNLVVLILSLWATAIVLKFLSNSMFSNVHMPFDGAFVIVFVIQLVIYTARAVRWPLDKLVGLVINPNRIKKPEKKAPAPTAPTRPKWRDTLYENLRKAISPTNVKYRVTMKGETNALIEVYFPTILNCSNQEVLALFQRHAGNVFYTDGVLIQVNRFVSVVPSEMTEFLRNAESF